MTSSMIALGIASVMMCLGILFRAKIPFLQKVLMPASVIGGILGFLFMNVVPEIVQTDLAGVDAATFNMIVNILFTISFIGICLSDPKKKSAKQEAEGTHKSGTAKGGLAMGLIWSALFVLTAGFGYFIILIVGRPFGMAPEYGTLIPTAFCQGPGQAAAMGLVYETTYGWENSSQVAVAFAVVGFLAAFFIGVPLAKYGMKKKIAKNTGKVTKAVEKGYFSPEEQRESLGKVTTHAGNVETLTIHVAVIGVCYLLAIGISKVIYVVPVLGPTISGMLFFNGMIAGYLVKFIMKKLNIYFLINSSLLSRITGWSSDYLVICAFMAVEIKTVGIWMIPIVIESIIVTLITFGICLYFGQRIGGENDFERVLGLFGTCTGTTPSGVALVRMVDPGIKTSTAVELGMMNMFMILSAPGTIFVTLGMTGVMPVWLASICMIICGIIYLLLLKPARVWNQPTFTLRKGRISDGTDDDTEFGFVKGFLREEHDMLGIVK